MKIKPERAGLLVAALLIVGGALAMVITHASLSCSLTENDQTTDCVSALFADNPNFFCPGSFTASGSDGIGSIELICPWGTSASVLTYAASGLALTFFGFFILNQDHNPLFFISAGSSFLLFIGVWLMMLIEIFSSDTTVATLPDGVTISEVPYILNAILVFLSGDIVLYMAKQTNQPPAAPAAQAQNERLTHQL